jgi:hypothetical protein
VYEGEEGKVEGRYEEKRRPLHSFKVQYVATVYTVFSILPLAKPSTWSGGNLVELIGHCHKKTITNKHLGACHRPST